MSKKKSSEYEVDIVPTCYHMYRKGDQPIFGESVTRVYVDDEAGGTFFRLHQSTDEREGEIQLNPEEIEPLFKLLMALTDNWKKIGD